MDKTVAVFTIIGGAASVVMAIAAVVALSTWRKQLAGTSHHELAKKLSAALRQVAIAREATLGDLRRVRKLDPNQLNDSHGEQLFAYAMHTLKQDAEQLSNAATELRALEGQVDVQWGKTMQQIVEVIAVESAMLASIAATDPADRIGRAAMGFIYASSDPIAPTVTGVAFEKALTDYTELAQQWLSPHVGREGAKAMSTEELLAKKRRVDDEVKRRAADERTAHIKTQAEQEQATVDRILAAGGPEAYLEQMRKEYEAKRAELEPPAATTPPTE